MTHGGGNGGDIATAVVVEQARRFEIVRQRASAIAVAASIVSTLKQRMPCRLAHVQPPGFAG